MNDTNTNEYRVYLDLRGVYNDIKSLKPNDRSDVDRYCAVMLTDLEKLLAYYLMYIVPEPDVEEEG